MKYTKKVTRRTTAFGVVAVCTLTTLAAGATMMLPNLIIGSDANSALNTFIQSPDPALTGGGRDQSLQFGDFLVGTNNDDVIIGLLGVDVIASGLGNDLVIGGPEHFNPQNRDRAITGHGDDIFVWSPGDGSDLFDGGPGTDVVVFGLLGENDGMGGVEFKVSSDQLAGDVALDSFGLPLVDVAGSPGFCEVIDPVSSPDAATELAALNVDHLVRFFIRGIADSFEAGIQDTDNGLRVTLHLRDVEFLVCTNRDGGAIEVLDLTQSPPTITSLTEVKSRRLSHILQ